jgi:hypothetical protein
METALNATARLQIRQIPCRRFPAVRTGIYVQGKKVGNLRGNGQLDLELAAGPVEITARHMGKKAVLEKVMEPVTTTTLELLHKETLWHKSLRFLNIALGILLLFWGLTKVPMDVSLICIGLICATAFLDHYSRMSWLEGQGELMPEGVTKEAIKT